MAPSVMLPNTMLPSYIGLVGVLPQVSAVPVLLTMMLLASRKSVAPKVLVSPRMLWVLLTIVLLKT